MFLINLASRDVCSIAGIRIVRTACRTFLPVVVDGSGGSHRTGNHAIRTSVFHIAVHRGIARDGGVHSHCGKFPIAVCTAQEDQVSLDVDGVFRTDGGALRHGEGSSGVYLDITSLNIVARGSGEVFRENYLLRAIRKTVAPGA